MVLVFDSAFLLMCVCVCVCVHLMCSDLYAGSADETISVTDMGTSRVVAEQKAHHR